MAHTPAPHLTFEKPPGRSDQPNRHVDDDHAICGIRRLRLSEIPTAHIRKPKRLLSGLLHCSRCGSVMTLNGGKYTCSAHRERGTCSNGKIIAAPTIERRVLAGLKDRLLAPQAVEHAVRQELEASAAERKQILASRAPIECELAEIGRKLARTQDMCLNEVISIAELKGLTDKHAARRTELEDKLALIESPKVVTPLPGLAGVYAELSARLHAALDEVDGEDLRAELRKLIERVDFIPLEGLGKFDLEVQAKHKALLVAERAFEDPTRYGERLGAGTGFEPVTFRL